MSLAILCAAQVALAQQGQNKKEHEPTCYSLHHLQRLLVFVCLLDVVPLPQKMEAKCGFGSTGTK